MTVREQNLRVAVRNLARVLGDDISEERPLLDSRLPDGSRVAAALPPVSLGGTTLTIRKFQSRHFSADELVRIGTLTGAQLDTLRRGIEARDNILISGGTGTGKTTLLNALAAFLPADDRLVADRGHGGAAAGGVEPGALRGAPRASRRAGGDAFATCCGRPCGTGPIGSCSARCVAAKRSICCRP